MDKKQFAPIMIFLLCFQYGLANAELRLPEQLTVNNTQLQQCSQGALTVFGFIPVGTAAIFIVSCEQLQEVLDSQPKVLRFSYSRAIPGDAFSKAAELFLEKNLGSQFSKWQEDIKQFNAKYRSVKAGDYYDLVYFPEQGLSLRLNAEEIATISNAELARAYFKIWLGDEPFSNDLKQALLTPRKQ